MNQWIRTSGVFDGVFDFDAAVRDPAHPLQFREAITPAIIFIQALMDTSLWRVRSMWCSSKTLSNKENEPFRIGRLPDSSETTGKV